MTDAYSDMEMGAQMPRPYPLPLPPPPRFFAGREPDLGRLDAELSGEGVRATIVSGPHGSGKTALIAHWAEDPGAERYPDQMYVRLSNIITLLSALERLCHSMAGVPTRLWGLEPLHRRYCELIETRNALVFLDDVNDTGEAQRWLVPPRGNCAIIMATVDPGERPYNGLRARITYPPPARLILQAFRQGSRGETGGPSTEDRSQRHRLTRSAIA